MSKAKAITKSEPEKDTCGTYRPTVCLYGAAYIILMRKNRRRRRRIWVKKKKEKKKKNGKSFANFLPRNEKFKFFRARSECAVVCVSR